jgi:hypothetical protein
MDRIKQKIGRIMTREMFISNQERHCSKIGAPLFLPLNGMCFTCGSDIISALIKRGEDGSKELITGCPICHRSYCD